MNTTRLALIAKAVNNIQNKPKAFINTQELKAIIDCDYVNIQGSSDNAVKTTELDFN